jgi:hypothetical protein
VDSFQIIDHKSGLKEIRFGLWATNPDLIRFVLSHGSQIRISKCIKSWTSQFSKDLMNVDVGMV